MCAATALLTRRRVCNDDVFSMLRPCRRTRLVVSPAERPARQSVTHGVTDYPTAPAGASKDAGWTPMEL